MQTADNELSIPLPDRISGDRVVFLPENSIQALAAGEVVPNPLSDSTPSERSELPVLAAKLQVGGVGASLPDSWDTSATNAALRPFLEGAFLTIPCGLNGCNLRVIRRQSAYAWLHEEFGQGRRGRKLRQLSHDLGDDYDQLDCVNDQLLDEIIATLKANQPIEGSIAICGCGEPGCSMEYGWIVNRVCLCRIQKTSCAICTVEFFPFDILTSWQDPRWLEFHQTSPVRSIRGKYDEQLIVGVSESQLDHLTEFGALELPTPSIGELVIVTDQPSRLQNSQSVLELRSALARCFLAESCGNESTQLRLQGPLPLDQLLQKATRQGDPPPIFRMHYSPDPLPYNCDPAIEWVENGIRLCELFRPKPDKSVIYLVPKHWWR